MDISYEKELFLKKEFLAETLGLYAVFLEKLHPAPSQNGYQNKIEFSFGDE